MFSKLFKRKQAPRPSAQAVAVSPVKPAKVEGPTLLQQLTGGQAIESITSSELLHQLVKHSDKLGKKTNQQVRERIQALREQEKNQQLQHDKAEKLCVRLETLARLQHHALFDSELAHVQQQWQATGDNDTTLAARFQAATTQCQQIQQHAATLKQEALAQALAQQEAELKKIAAQLAEKQAEAIAEEQTAAQQQEQTESKEQQLLKKQAQQAQHELQQKDLCQNLKQQLEKLEEAISNADSKKAREYHDSARDNLKKLDKKHVHDFDGKLHLLSGQLHELQDWQSFATLPKLEELCAAMEKLITIDLPPAQKAEAVRELQTQWRAVKAPSNKAAFALRERFQKISDKAWEPCAAYFEKERSQRAFNLQQRQAICDALEQFHSAQNWDKTDWKAVARILEKSRQEFHDFHPVERNEERGIRARFDAALAAINGKLLEEQQANEEKKRQLVEAAKSIATMTDFDKAAERVRQLQEQWKTIGLTRRHEDQKLWQQLQEQTGLVFEKRRANQQQQVQAQNDKVDLAKKLCEQIAALAKLGDAELTQSSAEFERLQAEYKAITDIPEKSQQFIKKQFYNACDAYRDQMAGITKRQRSAQLQELARRAQLCTQLEQQASDSAIDAIQNQWQAAALPAEWEQAIDKRRTQALAKAQQQQAMDYSANEQHLRNLCIELEILLDKETPEEDRQHRREYQLRKLQQGIGQAAGPLHEQQEKLLIQWYCASPAAPEKQAALQARFDSFKLC